MLTNPPFGVDWKKQQKEIQRRARQARLRRPLRRRAAAHQRRLAALPAAHDQQVRSRAPGEHKHGSRLAIVFNGSPLFTGGAGSGESDIRQWIIENDWLEAIVALPEQMFYNTGIGTYVWIVTNRKAPSARARSSSSTPRASSQKMRKSLGNKRNELADEQIAEITRLYGAFDRGRALQDLRQRGLRLPQSPSSGPCA